MTESKKPRELPAEIEMLRKAMVNKDHPNVSEINFWYDHGFNSGFAAFRDSEMMRELLSELKAAGEIYRTFMEYRDEWLTEPQDILERYKKWLGE